MSKRSATQVEDGGGDVDEREDQEQRRQQSVLDAIHVLQGALAEGATAPGFEKRGNRKSFSFNLYSKRSTISIRNCKIVHFAFCPEAYEASYISAKKTERNSGRSTEPKTSVKNGPQSGLVIWTGRD